MALRQKFALSKEMKARMEDNGARLVMNEREQEMERIRSRDERQKSKRKEGERGLEAVRRELQEEMYLKKARRNLVGFSMGVT